MGSEIKVRIRAATRADIPGVVQCDLTATAPGEDIGFGGPMSERTFADEGRLNSAWKDPNRVDSLEVIVALLDGQVVGFVTVEDRGEVLELHTIDVLGEFQRRGVGRQLVRWVEERASKGGKQAVTLGTSRNAEGVAWKSLPWWLSLGYRITGEEQNAWTRSIGPRVREIRMRKELA